MGKIVKPLGSIDKTSTKQEILNLAEMHASQIVSKKYDVLKVYIELKRYQLYLGSIAKYLKDFALSKAKKEGKKSFGYSYANITIQNRTKYNFENDKEWCELNNQIEHLIKLKKDRESILKNLPGEIVEIVDKDTGEVERLIAPIKEVVDQLIVRL